MIPLVAIAVLITGCEKEEDENPDQEHEHEVITDVKLIFTPNDTNYAVVEALAQDKDGDGLDDLVIMNEINLNKSRSYTLTFEILNKHDEDEDEDEHDEDEHDEDEHDEDEHAENIGEEIKGEAAEHQLFFSFTNNAFKNPEGDGNIDKASDEIDYIDFDDNGNPLGLITGWETSSSVTDQGLFKVILKHQPTEKTSE